MLDTPITQWVKIISEGVCTVWFVNDVAARDQLEPPHGNLLDAFAAKRPNQ